MTAFRDKEKEFSIVLENSPLGIVLTDVQNRFIYANPSFLGMLGYSEAELLAKSIVEITHPDSISDSKKAVAEVYDGKGPVVLEKQYICKDGSVIDARTRIAGVFDGSGAPVYQCTNIENITERKKSDQQLLYQATHDDLTGLVNRREFESRARQLVESAVEFQQEHVLCFMDLDQFKIVNDTCGHTAGDELLRQLGALLSCSLRRGDTLARLGGDEFGILLSHCSVHNAGRIIENIRASIRDLRFLWSGNTYKISVSIGVVAITDQSPDYSTVLRDADTACYMAKDLGRNRFHIYSPGDTEMAARQGEMQWVVKLTQAIDDDRLCLYAQAIAPMDDTAGSHYEILVRMIDEDGSIVPPGAFLPPAERYGMIAKLDRWVVENALDLLAGNPAFLSDTGFFSINLSGLSLADPEFLTFTETALRERGVEGSRVCFEITETAAISNLQIAVNFITTLKERGCLFALDDFGSGLSSFGYLKNLPVDYLKIDGAFVHDIADSPIDRAMVKSINEIGHVMGMKTIAECVENQSIESVLREIGVDYVQGYGIGYPLPVNEIN